MRGGFVFVFVSFSVCLFVFPLTLVCSWLAQQLSSVRILFDSLPFLLLDKMSSLEPPSVGAQGRNKGEGFQSFLRYMYLIV